MAGDAVTVAPNQYSVVEDNDRVRILEFRGGPGTVSKMLASSDRCRSAVRR